MGFIGSSWWVYGVTRACDVDILAKWQCMPARRWMPCSAARAITSMWLIRVPCSTAQATSLDPDVCHRPRHVNPSSAVLKIYML